MWKEILSAFKGGGLDQEAFDEAIAMLEASRSMHHDAVAALRSPGTLVADIYERDRELNRYERSVRRRVLTHLSVSSNPDIPRGLILTAIVIDIERIGDYTKNIIELAQGLVEPFDGGELHQDFGEVERAVAGMFDRIIPALEGPDYEAARSIIDSHKSVTRIVERGLQLLRDNKVLAGESGRAVTAALYLRYLKRVSAHLKNIATSVVNPYHRIGFREKRKYQKGTEARS
jgi:phosphate uptake regulator